MFEPQVSATIVEALLPEASSLDQGSVSASRGGCLIAYSACRVDKVHFGCGVRHAIPSLSHEAHFQPTPSSGLGPGWAPGCEPFRRALFAGEEREEAEEQQEQEQQEEREQESSEEQLTRDEEKSSGPPHQPRYP